MFWKKKAAVKPKPFQSRPLEPKVYPSTRRKVSRSKRINFSITCYLLVPSMHMVLETTSLNLSQTGILVKSLHPLEIGEEVLVLIANKKGLTERHIQNNKHTIKAVVVRLEQKGLLYNMAIKVTLGRVNPVGFMQVYGDTKEWWTRHWQGIEHPE
jgi:hypothetical protein